MDDRKPQEAVVLYDKVVEGSKGNKYPELYVDATVGKAESLILLKRYGEAEDFLNTVLKTATKDDLLAKARLGLGDCCFARASDTKDEKEARSLYKLALKNYLWNIVVFFNETGSYPKALLYAGKCWEKLGDVPRATELFNELRTKYGSSQWAKKITAK
jgi:tetratricopeptide (TPR) repeat protein